MIAATRWFCLGIPPRIPPCGAEGDVDSAAERHTKATKHATTSGTQRGAEAIHRAFVSTEPRMVAAGADSGAEVEG